MIAAFNAILYQPLLNALVFLYNTVAFGDFGVAIILLTVIIRLILFPVFHKSTRHQKQMQDLQPKLKKLQDQHKGDKAKQAEAMMALYKEHKISPFSGFLMLLIQIPILIALYQVFSKSLSPDFLSSLYSFVPAPENISHSFLGLINLAEKNIIIVILAAAAQYFQAKMSLSKVQPGQNLTPVEKMGRNMVYLGPALTGFILLSLPSALGLFWIVGSIFSIGQQIIINKESHAGELAKLPKQND